MKTEKYIPNASTPQQLPLQNLRDPRHRRPMMSIDAAKGALDLNEDEVLELVGTLLVAFNIASPDADRREVRILSKSVSHAHKVLEDGTESQKTRRWDWREIIGLILPENGKPWVTGLEVQRALNCSSTHVIENLIEKKALNPMPGTTWSSGAGNSPLIQRNSFVGFLELRLEDARNVVFERRVR